MGKMSVKALKNTKGTQKLTVITAYDYLFSRIFDGEVDMILVGDSLNMSFMGNPDTLSIDLDTMIYHTKAVCNGAPNTFIITDMPFGSYLTPEEALKNGVRVYQETNANAIKIEGGAEKAPTIQRLSENGIAVVGHIGLMPQFVRSEGYTIQGRQEADLTRLLKDAKAIETAGACAIVLEGVTSEVAEAITQAISIPTIGIGAGNKTDGQVLVWSDMFGFFEDFKPKFVRHYAKGAEMVRSGLRTYIEDVKKGAFPAENETY